MRLLVLGINYAPEVTGIAPYTTDLCAYLRRRGHTVRAITTFPYYPEWAKRPGDRHRLFRREEIDGVLVYRCWHYIPDPRRRGGRILHELSFGVTAFLRALVLPRPDLVLVVSPPLVLTLVAWLLSHLKGGRYVVHVQDLPLDGVLALGLLRPGWPWRWLRAAETFAYRHARFVSGISPGMVASFRARGLPRRQCLLFPNWVPPPRPRATPPPDRAALLLRFGLPTDAFLAFYSGNLGLKQGLDVLVDTAALLAALATDGAPRVHVVVAGAGASRRALESQCQTLPAGVLTLLPLLAPDDYADLLAATDVSIITQVAGAGNFCFPSKLLRITSARRAVVAVADAQSELALAVRGGGFGVVVPPGQPAALAACLRSLARQPERVAALAAHGTWGDQFAADQLLPRFEQQLQSVLASAAPTLPRPQPRRA